MSSRKAQIISWFLVRGSRVLQSLAYLGWYFRLTSGGADTGGYVHLGRLLDCETVCAPRKETESIISWMSGLNA
jgi:hypothetical protein